MEKAMAKSEIAFFCSAFFLLGLIAAGWGLSLWWIVLLEAIGLIFLFSFGFSASFLLLICFFISGVLGMFYFHGQAVFRERNELFPSSSEQFSVQIVGEGYTSGKALIISSRLLPPYRGLVDLILPPLTDLRYGQTVLLKGKIENGQWPEHNTIVFPTFSVASSSPSSFQGFAITTKEYLLRGFKRLLSSDEAALLSGLTFGVRSDFSLQFREAMRRSGTTHLVALSGYNISILILAIDRLLRSRLSRRFFFFLTTGLLLFFVFMVGAEASIVRAAIMGWLVLLASELGQVYSFRHAVLYAALGMSLWDSSLPSSHLGFQLSFLSLLGIVFLEPVISGWFRNKSQLSFFGWRESFATTTAAQLAVLPLLLLYFHSFSLLSIPANVLVLWVVPVVMGLGFLMAFFSALSLSFSFIFQPFLHLLLSYMIFVIELMSQVPVIEVQWGVLATIIYYLVLGGIAYRYHEKII